MSELSVALAEEIRQTLVWLGREHEPSVNNIRFRLRTLREAAATAHMPAVETVLADLDARLDEPAGAERAQQAGGLETVLVQLSNLVVSLAEPAEARELAWVAQVGQVESDLERVAKQLASASNRFDQLSLLPDRAAVVETEARRTELLVELGRAMRQEVERVRHWRRDLEAAGDRLRHAGRMLMRELSVVHRIPLDTTIARLRERVRRWGRSYGKPVSLRCRSAKLTVAVCQHEPLARVLEVLLDNMLNTGLQDPEWRREAGKATVASVVIASRQEGSLLELILEDDGAPDRPNPSLDKPVRSALHKLRSRLFCDGQAEGGLRLVLQLPTWHSTLEALPVRTPVGEVFVPLDVVDQIAGESDDELPVIELDRRAGDDGPVGAAGGLVLALGAWRGWLPAQVLGPVARLAVQPAADSDPPWVIARALEAQGGRPLIHPLPFASVAAGWTRLYPREGNA